MNKIDVVAVCVGLFCSHTIAYGRGEQKGWSNGFAYGKKVAKRSYKYQQEKNERKKQSPIIDVDVQ